MSNLDNLTSKIINDAEVKKIEILNEASIKADKLIGNKIEEATKRASSILERATLESKSARDRVISKSELEVRNNKLKAKQQIIGKVFEISKQKLKDMDSAKFTHFMHSAIISLDIDGDEEIIMNELDRVKLPKDFLERLNMDLLNSKKLGLVSFSNKNYVIDGGFIISKNGIEINNSFNELVDSLRYELEYEVGKILFSEK
ncbi:MAG: V-type ATP synthase subunit E family protein [Clostridium sp.]|uniref:V-type ATP synthase subunit E n=1 Tax=Clostridium sp. TaxID=1506 RepID=UPI003067287F